MKVTKIDTNTITNTDTNTGAIDTKAETEWQMRGKECSTEETIARAKEILEKRGFTLNYEEEDTGVTDCFASRLTLDPPGHGLIGTNGKGMSRQLCMASAFGEMMERFSNAALNGLNQHDPLKREIQSDQGRFYSLSAKEQPECIRDLKDRIAASMKEPEIFTKEDLINLILRNSTIDGDRIPAYPFYSVRKNQVEYLPLNLIRLFTGSNGMAAGNSIEEAVIEGSSEIFERYVQEKVIDGGITLPRIPSRVIEKYPHIAKVIREIEESGDRSVTIMDASLGMGLPVVCGVLVKKDSGRIGVKFGAHPNMAVAMERVFTEGTQGRTIEDFSRMNSVTFNSNYAGKRIEHWNTLKCGIGRMPAELLSPDISTEFSPWPDVRGESNHEIMWRMLDLMEKMGSDVYIRDTSVLGFPAVFIYASGISEAQQADWLTLSIMNVLNRREYILTHLKDASEEDVRMLSMALDVQQKMMNTKDVSFLMTVPLKYDLPGGSLQSFFMQAMCEYRLGNVEKAYEYVKMIIEIIDAPGENHVYENAVRTFLEGKINHYPEKQILEILKALYPSVAEKVSDDLSCPEKVLEKIYPLCNGMDCENCALRKNCMYPEVREVNRKMWANLNAYQPSDEEIIRKFSRRVSSSLL